ncbi:hypothetical protein B0H13DRAFT_1917517 [Mycena leptocephala]|nr:hypothetical protein B0H13DRAFT_1917517 [Mycena leptocephala]
MSNNAPPQPRARSQIDMPPLKTRGAPKKFTGKPQDVARFLSHVEKLFAENNVTDNVERVESMAEYCSRDVVHILEGMKNYSTPNWPLLVTDMLISSAIDSVTWSNSPRNGANISGWLENQGLITEAEAERYLWQGMCSSLHHVVEERLLAKNPTRDMTKPFKRDDIIKVIEAKFRRGRFDADVDSAESSAEDSDSSSDSDSDDSSDSDSDDLSPPKKKKKSKAKGKKRTRKPKATSAPAPAPITKTAARTTAPTDEVGDLIKRMSRMNIEDPDYNYLYYQATTLDPHVAKCLRMPILSVKAPPLPPNNFRNNQYVPPAEQFGGNPNPNANRPPVRPEDRGELQRGERGGLEWPDGRLLRRFAQQNETLYDAYIRQRQPPVAAAAAVQSNFASTTGIPIKFCNTLETVEEETIMPVFVQADTTNSELAKIFAVTMSSDKALRERPAPYPKQRPNTRAHVKETGAPLQLPLTHNSGVKQEVEETIPIQHIVDVIDHRVDFSKENAIMEDTVPVLKAETHQPQHPKVAKRAGPRQSAVSAFVDPNTVLNAILNTPVTLAAGQILGVSTPVSNALADALRLKNQPRNANLVDIVNTLSEKPEQSSNIVPIMSAATFITRDSQKLIRIEININGKTMVAIVDTGSMLNVASRAAWRKYMPHISMDITRHVDMGDANGGVKELRVYLQDVQIATGGAITTANF